MRPTPTTPRTPRTLTAALACCAALALLASACTGTDVGNPSDDPTLRFQFTAIDPAGALTLDSGLVIDEAWLAFNSLRLWSASDQGQCTGTERVDITGSFAVELVSGRELPDAPTVTTPPVKLCRLDFNLTPADAPPTDASADLAGASLVLKGTLPDGRPFLVQASLNELISLKTLSTSVTLDATLSDLLLTFDFASWITADTLTALQAITGDTVEVKPQTPGAQPILSAIQQGLKASIRLTPDENKDGRSQSGERAQNLAEGEP